MEKLYYSAKRNLLGFKLDLCCWFAPVRVGLFIIAYLNIVVDVVCMMGIANGGLMPTIVAVQDELIEDYVTTLAPITAYSIELGFNVVLLCALYRRDLVLMQVFLYYSIFAVVMSFLTYSMVMAAVAAQIQVAIVFSTIFQIYTIILARSAIVHMKTDLKLHEVPSSTTSVPTSYKYNVKNGQIQEITVTELPKQQHVQITVLGEDEKIKDVQDFIAKKDTVIKKDIVINKDTKEVAVVKQETDIEANNGFKKVIINAEPKATEIKKDSEVKVVIESENVEGKVKEKIKDEKKTKEEKKLEEKRLKEEKKKQEEIIKEEKKKEEKRLKEEKKLEKKKSKEEKTEKGEKTDKVGTTGKEENTDNEQQEKSKESTKDVREKWLQAPETSKQ